MGINAQFDATQFTPSQGGGAHPLGIFDAQVSMTECKPSKNDPQNAGLFEVEFTTPAGRIVKRYNLWNPSTQAVEIAQKELSALCYATGIFRLDFNNDGAAIRGARCKIDVQQQIDSKTKQPTQYVEVAKVLDLNGNEPGRPSNPAPQTQAAPQAPAAPMTQQPGGGWGNTQAQPAAAPAPNPGWGGAPANAAPAAAPAPGWGGAPQAAPNAAPAGNAPPWAK